MPKKTMKKPMYEIADPLVVKRLVRALRYRLTYVQVFESFLEPDPGPNVVQLLHSLMGAQQTAIASLLAYLASLEVEVQDLQPNRKLLDEAARREGVAARLGFIHYGLTRAVSWYKMQLTDTQMTADPELEQLLVDLGQSEAAKLWRVETTVAMLRIPVQPEPQDQPQTHHVRGRRSPGWRSRLMENVPRPALKGRHP